MAGAASLITRPFRQMAKGTDNMMNALAKRGSFKDAGLLERFGGAVGGFTKVGLNLASLPVYYPSLAVGGAIMGSGKVIKGFAKGLAGNADDVAEAGAKGLKKKTLSGAADATPQLSRQEAAGRWSWNDADGSHYYRKTKTRAKLDANGKPVLDADGKPVRERVGVEYFKDSPIGVQHIDGKEYGAARKKWLDSLPDESEIASIAEDVSETAAGDGAGINLWQFMSDHPVMGTVGMVGGGMLLGEFLDED